MYKIFAFLWSRPLTALRTVHQRIAAGWLRLQASFSSVVLQLAAFLLCLMPGAAHAQLSNVFSQWGQTARDFLNLLVTGAVVVGTCAIFYGLKLIWDKSNERADVKMSHILYSLGGGALLCVIWFVVTTLAASTGGGTVGQAASF